ncbi:chemokine XC receptor 1-like [Hoplias malabaricus]|uniref:chemokine XC receptor 1-like n=1 Tax=Hoplias malabaricus TaxID=27720 RepID=UPI0034628522
MGDASMDHVLNDSSYTLYDYNYSDLILPIEEEGLQAASSVTATFYGLIIVISLTGNGFLLWYLVKHKGLRSSANLLLLHLTVSDLVFTLTLVPWGVFHIWGWIFGDVACKLFSGAIFLGFYSYMMFLTCMTVHRYMAVVHALRISLLDARRGRFYTHLTCTAVWLFSTFCSLPEVLFSETVRSSEGMLCVFNYQSVMLELTISYVQIFVFFLLPFWVIILCYTQILSTIRRCQINNREHTVWLILATVVGFFLCWTPYNITVFLESLKLLKIEALSTFEWKKGLVYAYYITHITAYCHCCINPLIQIFGGVKFRSYLLSYTGFRRMSERERSHTFNSQSTPFHASVSGQTNV